MPIPCIPHQDYIMPQAVLPEKRIKPKFDKDLFRLQSDAGKEYTTLP